jgi:hypothetical protein
MDLDVFPLGTLLSPARPPRPVRQNDLRAGAERVATIGRNNAWVHMRAQVEATHSFSVPQ